MSATAGHSISPLGDSAVIVDFGNNISEESHRRVQALFANLREHGLPGTTDLVPAYSSLTLFYDVTFLGHTHAGGHSVNDQMVSLLTERVNALGDEGAVNGRLVEIPVCYAESFGRDAGIVAERNGLTVDELIAIHSRTTYKVYMLGFLPGFAYMGEVDERIRAPRKEVPSSVSAGSVGIAGSQTGIYPFHSPGGWQIIGRTPLKLFDPSTNHLTLLQPGDTVQFYPITTDEFTNF